MPLSGKNASVDGHLYTLLPQYETLICLYKIDEAGSSSVESNIFHKRRELSAKDRKFIGKLANSKTKRSRYPHNDETDRCQANTIKSIKLGRYSELKNGRRFI